MKNTFNPKNFLATVIDRLRKNGHDRLADNIQFVKDETGSYYCKICRQPMKKDPSHRCWIETGENL